MSQLEQLKQLTVVVSDTGDFQSIIKFQPTDATTNPTLLYQASKLPQYKALLDDACDHGAKVEGDMGAKVAAASDKLYVNFGKEILKIVKGRVSTEIAANLSFDVEATVAKAKNIISLYEKEGISRDRVLVKIASTWEGICAAKILEEQGIHVNMTLMFSKAQAIAAAQYAKVTLISPFVGRILDWHKAHDPKEVQEKYAKDPSLDPGVKSVTEIYNYYKKFDIKTVVMGASFRNKGEITELAGIDYLTISPQLLKELDESKDALPAKLSVEWAKQSNEEHFEHVSEKWFRWELNENPMATEKLAEGIRRFAADQLLLEKEIKAGIEKSLSQHH